MLTWNADEIRWYLAAEAASDYFARLGELVAAQLPPGAAVHDLGCGIGSLGVQLAVHGFPVTAVDSNPAAADLVRKRAARSRLPITVLTADYRTLAGPVPYPIFCLCGDLRQDGALLAQWGSRQAVVVTLDDSTLPFHPGKALRRAVSSAQLADYLLQNSLSFSQQSLQAEFGQPCVDHADAMAFLRHHNPEASQDQLTSYLAHLTQGKAELYLPSTKNVTVFSVQLPPNLGAF